MTTATVTASNHQQIRAVTMHPFVSGANRFTGEQLNSGGRAALLKIRRFNSQRARTIQNMKEEIEASGRSLAHPRQNQHKVRLELLRVAYRDPLVPSDLREIIGSFLPEVNPHAQG